MVTRRRTASRCELHGAFDATHLNRRARHQYRAGNKIVIEVGEKLHVIYRSLYDKSNRRHFIGKVLAAKDGLCRLEGYFVVHDDKKTEFFRKDDKRTIILDLGDSGFVVHLIDPMSSLTTYATDTLRALGL